MSDCTRKVNDRTYVVWGIEYTISEEGGTQRRRLLLGTPFWLTKMEGGIIVVIWNAA